MRSSSAKIKLGIEKEKCQLQINNLFKNVKSIENPINLLAQEKTINEFQIIQTEIKKVQNQHELKKKCYKLILLALQQLSNLAKLFTIRLNKGQQSNFEECQIKIKIRQSIKRANLSGIQKKILSYKKFNEQSEQDQENILIQQELQVSAKMRSKINTIRFFEQDFNQNNYCSEGKCQQKDGILKYRMIVQNLLQLQNQDNLNKIQFWLRLQKKYSNKKINSEIK